MPALARDHPPRWDPLQNYPVALYFLIAYAFSWLVGGVLIARAHGLVTAPQWLH